VRLVVLAPLVEGAATVMVMEAKGCEEERGPRLHHRSPTCGRPVPRSTDAPGAAGEELGAGDELAGFEGLLDGGLVRLAGGGEAQPLGIEGFLVVDLDGLGLAGTELVIRKGEAGGGGLQPGEDQDEGVLE
jgi:hypothetical protein